MCATIGMDGIGRYRCVEGDFLLQYAFEGIHSHDFAECMQTPGHPTSRAHESRLFIIRKQESLSIISNQSSISSLLR